MSPETYQRLREARARIAHDVSDSGRRTADLVEQLEDCHRALEGDEAAAARVLGGTILVEVPDVPTARLRRPPPKPTE